MRRGPAVLHRAGEGPATSAGSPAVLMSGSDRFNVQLAHAPPRHGAALPRTPRGSRLSGPDPAPGSFPAPDGTCPLRVGLPGPSSRTARDFWQRAVPSERVRSGTGDSTFIWEGDFFFSYMCNPGNNLPLGPANNPAHGLPAPRGGRPSPLPAPEEAGTGPCPYRGRPRPPPWR